MKNINGWLYRTPTLVERFKNALQGWRKPILVGRNIRPENNLYGTMAGVDTRPNLKSENFESPP